MKLMCSKWFKKCNFVYKGGGFLIGSPLMYLPNAVDPVLMNTLISGFSPLKFITNNISIHADPWAVYPNDITIP